MEPIEHNGIKKTLTAIGVILLLVIGVYFFVFHKTVTPPPALDEFGNPVAAQTVGSDLIALLAKLQNVSLNDAIFQKPSFIQLTDFSTTLPSEAAGRANPFASLSGGGVYKSAVKSQ